MKINFLIIISFAVFICLLLLIDIFNIPTLTLTYLSKIFNRNLRLSERIDWTNLVGTVIASLIAIWSLTTTIEEQRYIQQEDNRVANLPIVKILSSENSDSSSLDLFLSNVPINYEENEKNKLIIGQIKVNLKNIGNNHCTIDSLYYDANTHQKFPEIFLVEKDIETSFIFSYLLSVPIDEDSITISLNYKDLFGNLYTQPVTFNIIEHGNQNFSLEFTHQKSFPKLVNRN